MPRAVLAPKSGTLPPIIEQPVANDTDTDDDASMMHRWKVSKMEMVVEWLAQEGTVMCR